MAGIIPRSQLPPNIRMADAARRKNHRSQYPKWFFKPHLMERIVGVFADYSNCMTLPELMTKYHISMRQIYNDIDSARELQKINLLEEVDQVVERSVARRQRVIRDCDREIESLRNEYAPNPQRANAIANVLRVKSAEQTKIEEIMALRNRTGQVESPDGMPLDAPDGQTVVFDMTTQQVVADDRAR